MARPEKSARVPGATEKLGQMLKTAGLISPDQLKRALALQKKDGRKIGSALVELGAIDEDVLATFLGMQKGIEAVPLAERRIAKEVLCLISRETAYKYGAVPVQRNGRSLTVVLVDPGDRKALDALAKETGLAIEPAIAPQTSIWNALKKHYPEAASGSDVAALRKKLAEARRMLEEIDGELAKLG